MSTAQLISYLSFLIVFSLGFCFSFIMEKRGNFETWENQVFALIFPLGFVIFILPFLPKLPFIDDVVTISDVQESAPIAFEIISSILFFLILENWISEKLPDRRWWDSKDSEETGDLKMMVGFFLACLLTLSVVGIVRAIYDGQYARQTILLIQLGLGIVYITKSRSWEKPS